MSNFIIELIDPQTTYLEIESSIGSVVNNIEIERFQTFNLEIVNTEKILASDLPDDIPMSKIVGNLDVNRIDNLDVYLTGFLDAYQFDGGTP